MAVRAVCFDVGETLVDETRFYQEWADWLDVPALTFMGVLGGLIQQRRSHLEVFEAFRPGMDVERDRAERTAAGDPYRLEAGDLYPDAVPCLERLRAAGLVVGLAGNQPAEAKGALERLDLPVDHIFTSEGWGVEKPDPDFFRRLAHAAGIPPSDVAYVGDRVDNDVVPAADAGMVAVFLRRGPWGRLQAEWPEAARAAVRIDSLDQLPAALAATGDR